MVLVDIMIIDFMVELVRMVVKMDMLKKYLKPLKFDIANSLFLKGIAAIASLMIPYLLAYIIDSIVPVKDINLIFVFGALMIIISLLGWFFDIIANRKASKVARDAIIKIRHDLFAKTINLSCRQYDQYTTASLESRLTSDTYNVHRMIGMMQRMGVRAPILLIGGLVITFIMEPYLAFVMLCTLPFITILIYKKATKGISLFNLVQKAQDKMIAVVRENTQGMRIIKALSKAKHEKSKYEDVNHRLIMHEREAAEKMAIINPLMNLMMNIGLVLVILAGAYRVYGGLSEVGKIIAFTNYFTLITNAMMAVSRMFVMYSKGIASANRIQEILAIEDEMMFVDDQNMDNEYAVEFQHVNFSYLKVKDNIQDVSFKLKKGQTLGIIGVTGSGKSTLIQLLLRFYDVDSGLIKINGKDIRSYQPNELRSHYGIVMQNDFVFQDTIKENIKFGRQADDEMISETAINAQAISFIDEFDDQFEHKLNSEGTNLSGGQRQRILLSRAFLNRPQILLLDDSSSALDYVTDAKLRKAINNEFESSTKIIVAQRISSIMHADEIIVMDNGKIIAKGKHENLIKNNDVYASISETQMGGALFE